MPNSSWIFKNLATLLILSVKICSFNLEGIRAQNCLLRGVRLKIISRKYVVAKFEEARSVLNPFRKNMNPNSEIQVQTSPNDMSGRHSKKTIIRSMSCESKKSNLNFGPPPVFAVSPRPIFHARRRAFVILFLYVPFPYFWCQTPRDGL